MTHADEHDDADQPRPETAGARDAVATAPRDAAAIAPGTSDEAGAPGRASHSFARRAAAIDRRWIDAALAALVIVGAVAVAAADQAPDGFRGADVLALVMLIVAGLSFLLLHRFPFVTLVVVGTVTDLVAILGYDQGVVMFAAYAFMLALFAITVSQPFPRGVLAGGFTGLGLVVFVAGGLWSDSITLFGAVAAWISTTVVWIVGMSIRLYSDRARAAREQAHIERERADLFRHDLEMHAMEAVSLERTRLARELHDSVGHALNVVVVQAGAAQRVFDKKPDLAREALAAIEATGRQALGDIERMLGILRAEEPDAESLESQPGIDQIAALIDQVRDAGLPVEYVVDTTSCTMPDSIDLSVYRIVQEALTNTLKHAGPAHASVAIACSAESVTVEVLDDGRGAAAGLPAVGPEADAAAALGGRRGLVGMRERVLLFGGELQAGPRPEGGYRVYARLPLPAGAVGSSQDDGSSGPTDSRNEGDAS